MYIQEVYHFWGMHYLGKLSNSKKKPKMRIFAYFFYFLHILTFLDFYFWVPVNFCQNIFRGKLRIFCFALFPLRVHQGGGYFGQCPRYVNWEHLIGGISGVEVPGGGFRTSLGPKGGEGGDAPSPVGPP